MLNCPPLAQPSTVCIGTDKPGWKISCVTSTRQVEPLAGTRDVVCCAGGEGDGRRRRLHQHDRVFDDDIFQRLADAVSDVFDGKIEGVGAAIGFDLQTGARPQRVGWFACSGRVDDRFRAVRLAERSVTTDEHRYPERTTGIERHRAEVEAVQVVAEVGTGDGRTADAQEGIELDFDVGIGGISRAMVAIMKTE